MNTPENESRETLSTDELKDWLVRRTAKLIVIWMIGLTGLCLVDTLCPPFHCSV
jgi:hypothetical protein